MNGTFPFDEPYEHPSLFSDISVSIQHDTVEPVVAKKELITLEFEAYLNAKESCAAVYITGHSQS